RAAMRAVSEATTKETTSPVQLGSDLLQLLFEGKLAFVRHGGRMVPGLTDVSRDPDSLVTGTLPHTEAFRSRLGAVALFELLAGSAPAGVVAADLVRRAGLNGDWRQAKGRRGAACGRDRLRALRGLVLVAHVSVALLLLRELLLRLLGRELRVEEMEHDFTADRAAQLGEHALALGCVLDAWSLLRHRA